MRVTALTAGILLTSALVSGAVQAAVTAKPACSCERPQGRQISHPARIFRAAPRHVARHLGRPVEGRYYSYSSAPPVSREWHGAWRAAPNDAYLPASPAAYYGPPPGTRDPSIQIDPRSFTGGVGVNEEGGGGGGGGDLGQIHFANGGSVENGPTYNDYNQSFQFNPSQPGPFQNRLMGGFAPPPAKK